MNNDLEANEMGASLPEHLKKLIEDQSWISEEQREAILADGNFILLACPGSGKTRTVGLRAARLGLANPPLSVAATSYTNVAVDEIRNSAREAGLIPAEPHFVGTLHSFLLRFVFYPFGHLVMGCSNVPVLIPDWQEHSVPVDDDVWLGDSKTWAKVWDFHIRADGSMSAQSKPHSSTG